MNTNFINIKIPFKVFDIDLDYFGVEKKLEITINKDKITEKDFFDKVIYKIFENSTKQKNFPEPYSIYFVISGKKITEINNETISLIEDCLKDKFELFVLSTRRIESTEQQFPLK